jgi:phosphopantothenoylcysteine decarboxylase/phosphopantothenate--cysteine ligase
MTAGTLEGKRIVLAVTGSIAAVETVKLAHALRRCGAEVQGVMSQAACGIIHPDAISYATGRPAITRLSGLVEHVTFCGDGGSADLLLIAPCTGNTLAKIACGIDDTPVTTFAATAVGSGLPVIIVPAMHHSMYRHPAVSAHLARMKEWGITVTEPRIEEGRAKIAETGEIVLHCERALLGHPLAGKRVLITSGPCREPVDDIRVLTTRSSGKMGRALALQAFRLGAGVTVVHAGSFPCVRNLHAETAAEMQDTVIRAFGEKGFDVYISAAAISDFAPERAAGKIPSGKTRSLRLEPVPKLLGDVISRFHPFTVAFKLGWDEEAAARRMLEDGAALVIVNAPSVMGAQAGEAEIISAGTKTKISGTKEELAAAIWRQILASVNSDPPSRRRKNRKTATGHP